jgi:hypothetical protein
MDHLALASDAAITLRNCDDPETVLKQACAARGLPFPDPTEPLAIRLIRTIVAAGEHHGAWLESLNEQRVALWAANRAAAAGTEDAEDVDACCLCDLLESDDLEEDEEDRDPRLAPRDAEAERLYAIVNSEPVEELRKRDLLQAGWGGFHVLTRKLLGVHGGRWIDVRHETMSPEEIEQSPGLMIRRFQTTGLPTLIHGLIDYPLEVRVRFEIPGGPEPWSLWDICRAFADQYARIYQEPERYGVWGHDLQDLSIDGLVYYEQEQFIFPLVSS